MRASRRQFVQGVGVAGAGLLAGCGRLPWQAQPATRIPRLGFLSTPPSPREAAFRQGLQELGYVEGQNIVIEARYEQGEPGGPSGVEQFTALATELSQLPVDVIATDGIRATRGARAATATVPIVQIWGAGDLVPSLAESLARPGGNVTGMTIIVDELVGKWLELLKETAPGISRVAVLSPTPPGQGSQLALETRGRAAAQALGLDLRFLPTPEPGDVDPALEAIGRGDDEGRLVVAGVMLVRREQQIIDLATKRRLPSIMNRREFALEGGLLAYAESYAHNGSRAATLVDKILRGANPAELPIERPTRFDFVVNLKTAQVLGLTIPQHMLLQATEVIQ